MAEPTRPYEVHITAVRLVVVEAATDAEAVAAAEQILRTERRWLAAHHWKIRDVEPGPPWHAAVRREDTP